MAYVVGTFGTDSRRRTEVRLTKAVVTILFSTTSIACFSAPWAHATDGGSAPPPEGSHDRSVTVVAGSGGAHGPVGTSGTTSTTGAGSGGGPTCFTEQGRSVDVVTSSLEFAPATHDNPVFPAPKDDHHVWVITHCTYPDGHRTNDVALVDTTPAPGVIPAPAPAITPAQLALRATAHLHLEFPGLNLSPPAHQVVGFPTWFWIDPAAWQPQHATDTDGTLTVDLTATPADLVVDPGDGTATIDCHGPGSPYRPGHDDAWATSTCGHTYTTPSSRLPGKVTTTRSTLVWRFTWTASDGTTGTLPDLRLDHRQALVVTAYTAVTD